MTQEGGTWFDKRGIQLPKPFAFNPSNIGRQLIWTALSSFYAHNVYYE
jgi:hypothetical protein